MTTATPPQEGNCWKRDRKRNRLDGFFVPFTTGLFDGNIAAITYKYGYLTNTNDYYTNNTIGDIYRYDKLGRLREDLFLVNNTGTSFTRNIGTKQNMYDSRYIYDPNSNIKHLSRRSLYDNAGNVQSTQIDSLTYNYPSSTSNRLGHVTDIIPTATPGVNDLPTQAPNRYEYDNSGNLIKDNENNVEYSWNAQGKVYEIRRISGPDQFTVRFDYDAQGNKVRKQVFTGTNTTPSSTTYYVYDATGTLMAVYKKEGSNSVYLSEAPINAPGRIGMWRFGATEKLHSNNSIADNVRIYNRYINKKLYELTDQTGNVRAVVGDSKTWSGNETVPHVPMSSNYYPYGMAQAGRVASTGADYRYGYNGMEEEDRGDQVSAEIASTGEKPKPGEGNLLNTEYRLYDPRLAQWLTRDPVFQPWESPYSAMAGNPILFSDPQGLNNKKGGLQPGFQGPPERPGTENNPVEVPEVVVRPKNNGNTQTTDTKSTPQSEPQQESKVAKIAKHVMVFIGGVSYAISTNEAMGLGFVTNKLKMNPTETVGDEYKETAAAGEVVGHAISVVKGVREVVTGVGGLLGSGAVTLGTAGAATPITAGTGTAHQPA